MDRRSLVRVTLVCLLVGLVGLQLVDYAARMDDEQVYPTGQELDRDFAAFHGQEVDSWVTVTARYGTSFTTARGWTVTADSLPPHLDPGDSVQVYGIARPGPRIDARRVVVTDTPNRQYMFAVSGLALLLVAGLVYRDWRPDLRTLTLRPRDADRAPDETGQTEATGGEADD